MQLKGKLVKWNAEKAFGFIAPFAGGKDIFIHKAAFKNKRRIPELNDIIVFKVTKDSTGRFCASHATFVGEKIHYQQAKEASKFSLLLAITFLLSVAGFTYTGVLPTVIKYIYWVFSFITFMFYAYDKFCAQRNRWRIPEKTLHILSFVGGWPGALLAQQILRHKSSKKEFRFNFRVTVVLNTAVLVWLLSPAGESALSLLNTLLWQLLNELNLPSFL